MPQEGQTNSKWVRPAQIAVCRIARCNAQDAEKNRIVRKRVKNKDGGFTRPFASNTTYRCIYTRAMLCNLSDSADLNNNNKIKTSLNIVIYKYEKLACVWWVVNLSVT
mmetsp:Transcript_6560/g.7446  ORF Transcript_6560/g.7446 Transcript_6560/m.7446 type:complete len:108 (+) Transcript_6560:654-977(+)